MGRLSKGMTNRYLASEAHEEIRQHTRGLMSGTRPVVKRYEITG
jgi:hypothetical protein